MAAAIGSRRSVLALCILAAGGARAGTGGVDPMFDDSYECATSHVEGFDVDGPWPAQWNGNGANALADVSGGMARLRPFATGYSLARMVAPIATRDVEVTFAFRMEDQSTQGVGFYVRQNGGYLTQTATHGEGYAVFVAGGWYDQPMGVWKEDNGVEIRLAASSGVAFPLSNTLYRVRFRVTQTAPGATTLQARFWPDGQAEPAAWQAQATDATASLQNLTAGIAVDSWSTYRNPAIIAGHTFVDDIALTILCPPF